MQNRNVMCNPANVLSISLRTPNTLSYSLIIQPQATRPSHNILHSRRSGSIARISTVFLPWVLQRQGPSAGAASGQCSSSQPVVLSFDSQRPKTPRKHRPLLVRRSWVFPPGDALHALTTTDKTVCMDGSRTFSARPVHKQQGLSTLLTRWQQRSGGALLSGRDGIRGYLCVIIKLASLSTRAWGAHRDWLWPWPWLGPALAPPWPSSYPTRGIRPHGISLRNCFRAETETDTG